MFTTFSRGLVLALAAATAVAVIPPADLQVKTSSGTVRGHVNETTPGVRRWLGVRYAQSPTGNLRWMPPVAQGDPGQVVDGSKYSVVCPQYEEPGPGLDSETREFLYTGPMGEDCLTLSVYTPATPKSDNLPVFIWIHGGSLQVGGSTVPYEDPSKWVQRTQEHVVVGVQYRLNLWGFPNAAGLTEQNLGFLDQRMGIEWVKQNIASFGGDPSRMTLFGQSAGGQSTDTQNFAHWDDPIVAGFIPISGSHLMGLETRDEDRTAFANLAKVYNCSSADAAAQLACMQGVSMENLVTHIRETEQSFFPFVDDRTHFSDPIQRIRDGKISDRPVFYTTTLNEGIGFVDFPDDPSTQTPDLAAARDFTLDAFLCPAARLTAARVAAGKTTFRAEYRGNFTNISRYFWVGAWHSADLPLIFGTHNDYFSPSTPFEAEVSLKMQDLFLAFGKDPKEGLANAGLASAASGNLMAFATNEDATGHGGNAEGRVAVPVPIASVDAVCEGRGSAPPPGGGKGKGKGERRKKRTFPMVLQA
ncbi:hypothetical protein ACJZ2D_010635 [Fusarium nematophilum]